MSTIEDLQKQVEQRISSIKPDLKEILKLYLGRYTDYQVKKVRYSWKFLDFPQVLMLKCKYWSSVDVPKPSLETLESIQKIYKANKNEIKIELAFKDIKKLCIQYLRDTDYMFLTDYRFEDQSVKNFYIEYRKYLRDVPDNLSRRDVAEAKVLTFEDWKKTKGY